MKLSLRNLFYILLLILPLSSVSVTGAHAYDHSLILEESCCASSLDMESGADDADAIASEFAVIADFESFAKPFAIPLYFVYQHIALLPETRAPPFIS